MWSIWYVEKHLFGYHTIYSFEHIDYNKNYETSGSLLTKMLEAIQLSVFIVYNDCGGVFLNIRYFTVIMIAIIVKMMSGSFDI